MGLKKPILGQNWPENSGRFWAFLKGAAFFLRKDVAFPHFLGIWAFKFFWVFSILVQKSPKLAIFGVLGILYGGGPYFRAKIEDF